jgi:hypothetical protein
VLTVARIKATAISSKIGQYRIEADSFIWDRSKENFKKLLLLLLSKLVYELVCIFERNSTFINWTVNKALISLKQQEVEAQTKYETAAKNLMASIQEEQDQSGISTKIDTWFELLLLAVLMYKQYNRQ